MEAADNALTPRAWEDGFEIGWDQAHETVGGGPTPDAMPQSQHLTDAEFNDLLVELCNPDTYDFPDLDGMGNQYRPQIEPSLTTELTSPSSSGGVTQTPSSGDFDFISSPGSYQTPHMSPNSLMESPQACFAGRDKLAPHQLNISPFTREGFAPGAPSMAPSENFDFNSPPGLYQGPYMSPNSLMGSPQVCFAGPSQFTPDQINSSPYIREGVAPEAPSMAPLPLSRTNRASRKALPRVKSSPPGMKASGMRARLWRKIYKPVRCPACPMDFDYQSDLDKHLIAIHPQIAIEHGLSTDRHVCERCHKTYARKDGLKRHLTKKHQRQKTWRRRPQN